MAGLGMLLQESASLLRREFERAALPHELTLMQWRVLAQLARQGPARQVEIGRRLATSPMTISDVADRLETAGLVRRDTDPDDSRAKRVSLSKAGRELIQRMSVVVEDIMGRALAGVGPAEVATTIATLDRIIVNLDHRTAERLRTEGHTIVDGLGRALHGPSGSGR